MHWHDAFPGLESLVASAVLAVGLFHLKMAAAMGVLHLLLMKASLTNGLTCSMGVCGQVSSILWLYNDCSQHGFSAGTS